MRNIIIIILLLFQGAILANPIKTELKNIDGNWQLLRDGSPYYIKGAGGWGYQDKLVEIGGNSIRTWSAENAKEILDNAQKHGLTVLLGLWVQHERHGFDYDDDTAVKKQLDRFTRIVNELKDHPALLMWGIGNEVDLNYTNTKVWDAIQDIAKMIHEIDPNHPTSTITAGLDSSEVNLIITKAPDIDIYGINTYGDLGNIDNNIVKYGWKGPYVITEWGPNGHWEVEKTPWGVPIEQNSSEKADVYLERYQKYIEPNKQRCLGSYVFLWGQKQETTSTWYGLFSENHQASEAINSLFYVWRGIWPEKRAPRIDSVIISGSDNSRFAMIKPHSKNNIEVSVLNPSDDKLKYKWYIMPESTDIGTGGDVESKQSAIPGLIKRRSQNKMSFISPEKEGPYRVFFFVYDTHGHFSYTNIPIYVNHDMEGEARKPAIRMKKRSLEIQ